MRIPGSEILERRWIDFYFFPAKKFGRPGGGGVHVRLGWTVLCFHGARGGAPEGERMAFTSSAPEQKRQSSFGNS
jgi:hypothetical protein